MSDHQPDRGPSETSVAVERSVPGAGRHGLVTVTEPLTFGNGRPLRDAAIDLVGLGQPWLLVDLSACTQLDRAGLAALVGIRHRTTGAGGCLHLFDRTGTATRALRRSGLARLLPIDSSLAGALDRNANC